jgi:hypothetical protein
MCSEKGRKASGLSLHEEIRRLVGEVVPSDTLEEQHRRQALAWLDRTGDIFRRIKPGTPDPRKPAAHTRPRAVRQRGIASAVRA